MRQLRRALYLQAAVWAAVGVALATVPRFVLVTVFDQPPQAEEAWLRLLGIHAVGLGMLMVLVAHRADEVWWWCWAFALVTVGVTAVVLLNTAFGLAPGQGRLLWWIFSAVSMAFSLALLYGLFVASSENPVP
jgi:hypothetical protein